MFMRIQKSLKEKDEGFTLIELLVVIIIIGILAAIAIPVFLNQRKKATESSMKSDLRTIANEMETYFADYQAYPTVAIGTGSVTVGTNTIKLSSGNVAAAVPVSTGTFCVGVYNNNAGGLADALYYDSDAGGLLPKGTGCS